MLVADSTLPVTALVRKDGTVAWSQTGAITADDPALGAALEAALR